MGVGGLCVQNVGCMCRMWAACAECVQIVGCVCRMWAVGAECGQNVGRMWDDVQSLDNAMVGLSVQEVTHVVVGGWWRFTIGSSVLFTIYTISHTHTRTHTHTRRCRR